MSKQLDPPQPPRNPAPKKRQIRKPEDLQPSRSKAENVEGGFAVEDFEQTV